MVILEYIHDITLHLIPSGEIPVIRVKQGDTSVRFVRVKVVQDDEQLIPGAEQVILFREEKPDRTGVLLDSAHLDDQLNRYLVTLNNDGTISVELTEQTTTCVGLCRCDLCFISGGNSISTSPFVLDVEAVPDITRQIISSNDFRTLINALDHVWENGIIAMPGAVASGYVILGTTWSGDDPYTFTITSISGYTPTTNTVVNVMNDADVIQQMIEDDVTHLYITNTDGTLTAHAVGGMPSAQMIVPVIFVETDSATYDNVQDGQVIAYDGTAGTWVNKDISDYGFMTESGVRTIVTSYGYQTETQVTNLIREYIQTIDGNNTEY